MRFRLCLCLLLLCGLAACGELPEPFLGNPGGPLAQRLSHPAAPRLVVSPPANALLGDEASRNFAGDLAQALQARAVPAFAQPAQPTDWRLVATANARAATVVPTFTVFDPQGQNCGKVTGPDVASPAWEAASPQTLTRVADESAPRIANLLTRIETLRQEADPNSLFNRPPRVMIGTVTGAPGNGDVALEHQLRKRLGLLGPKIQDTAKNADFTVRGHVRVVPISQSNERVEIQWTIRDQYGRFLGKVIQLNVIPTGSLDHDWGDVAVVVATRAAAGVEHVMREHRMVEPDAQVQAAALRGQGGNRLLEGQPSESKPVRQ